ncbi:sigma-54-dependent transcriptional regulator [Endozoicomonadaceae bacterium StTr2]
MAAAGRILIVEDDFELGDALREALIRAGYKAMHVPSAEDALVKAAQSGFDAVVADVNLPGMDGVRLLGRLKAEHPQLPVLIMSGYADAEQAVDVMKAGAMDYMSKPFAPRHLLEKLSEIMPRRPDMEGGMIAESPAIREVLRIGRRVAKSDITVLLTGESGVGKEVAARYIHAESKRQKAPFVAVNCAAIPESMLESILFGHEKGAFTGATTRHAGKFEQADSGTLFLDEVGEMPLEQQAKLLRVLQENEVDRLGSTRPLTVDVRIVAATNQNLESLVRKGAFRADLYYRLNVIPLHLPPLRERREDIMPLARYLLEKHSSRSGRHGLYFSDETASMLEADPWRGNVRELENVVQRACVLCTGTEISPEDLLLKQSAIEPEVSTETTDSVEKPAEKAAAAADAPPLPDLDALPGGERRKAEWRLVLETLRQCGGHRGRAAQVLEITPRMLRYKLARMRDYGVDTDSFLEALAAHNACQAA